MMVGWLLDNIKIIGNKWYIQYMRNWLLFVLHELIIINESIIMTINDGRKI